MKAVIAQFYNTIKRAEKKADENKKRGKGKIAWYIVCAPNGYFVISETAARKAFPQVDFSFKDRRYIEIESPEKLSTGGLLTPQRRKSNI